MTSAPFSDAFKVLRHCSQLLLCDSVPPDLRVAWGCTCRTEVQALGVSPGRVCCRGPVDWAHINHAESRELTDELWPQHQERSGLQLLLELIQVQMLRCAPVRQPNGPTAVDTAEAT